jgi:hypothetical protein
VEVLEWKRRLDQASEVQLLLSWAQRLPGPLGKHVFAEARARLRRLGATHLIQAADQRLDADYFEETYEDAIYRVYDLRPHSK